MIDGTILQIIPAQHPCWAVQLYDDGAVDALRIHAYALVEREDGTRAVEPLGLYHYGLDVCPGDYVDRLHEHDHRLEARATPEHRLDQEFEHRLAQWWKFWK